MKVIDKRGEKPVRKQVESGDTIIRDGVIYVVSLTHKANYAGDENYDFYAASMKDGEIWGFFYKEGEPFSDWDHCSVEARVYEPES